jgi:predicted nuclease of predicted toxin-antitoxin system
MAVEGLSASVYLDHNADPELAQDLRRHGFVAVVARELGLERASDDHHLRTATSMGHVLFTHDFDDYPVLAIEWAARGEPHAGIILASTRISYGETLRRLLHLLDSITADEFVNRVEWI